MADANVAGTRPAATGIRVELSAVPPSTRAHYPPTSPPTTHLPSTSSSRNKEEKFSAAWRRNIELETSGDEAGRYSSSRTG